jgi:hypothetical protein
MGEEAVDKYQYHLLGGVGGDGRVMEWEAGLSGAEELTPLSQPLVPPASPPRFASRRARADAARRAPRVGRDGVEAGRERRRRRQRRDVPAVASECEWELAPAAVARATRARWSSARDRHREEREDGERGDTIQAGARCSSATAWLWKNEMDLRSARDRREKRFCIVGARPAKGARISNTVSCIPRAWPWYFGSYQTHPKYTWSPPPPAHQLR